MGWASFMNFIRLKTQTKIFLGLILAHLGLLFSWGYFLSPEFPLYSFLVHKGFLPYQDILDQHFPSLIIGPLSLPYFLIKSQTALLVMFFLITLLTDVFLYLYLSRKGTKRSLFILFAWIIISLWFGGNTLWIETIVTLLLALSLFLSLSDRPLSWFSIGFLLAVIIISRPTLAPFLLIFLISLKPGKKLIQVTIGGLITLMSVTLYLLKYQLLPDFWKLTVIFNAHEYLQYAKKVPTLRQLVEVGLVSAVPAIVILKNKKYAVILTLLGFLTLAYPRFEYVHLQPYFFLLVALALPLLDKVDSKFRLIFYSILFIAAVFVLKSALRTHYGNFFYDSRTQAMAQYLKGKEGSTLYVIGASPLLYTLTDRVPPQFTYLPALPWYFANKDLRNRMSVALLTSPATPVVVDPNATVDGVNILKSTGALGDFIQKRYTLTATVSGLMVYQRLP